MSARRRPADEEDRIWRFEGAIELIKLIAWAIAEALRAARAGL